MITNYSTTSASGYLVIPTHRKTLDASSTTVSETWITYDTNTVTRKPFHCLPPVWRTGCRSSNTVSTMTYDTYGNMTDQYDASGMPPLAQGNHLHQDYESTYHQFLSTSTQEPDREFDRDFIFDPFTVSLQPYDIKTRPPNTSTHLRRLSKSPTPTTRCHYPR